MQTYGQLQRFADMITPITALVGQRKNAGVIVVALLAAGAVGWSLSKVSATNAAAVENSSPFEAMRKSGMKTLPPEESKLGLVGSYKVTGTDSEGKPYVGVSVLDVSLVPSGALELDWDNGKQVGVGQVIGNALVVAFLNKGRTVVLVMSISPDGSLSGKSLRRTDRGSKGTETWKKS
jgi:hypothetical protein